MASVSWATGDENDDDHTEFMKLNFTMRTQRLWNWTATALRGARRDGEKWLCGPVALMLASVSPMAAQGDEAKPAGVSAV